ncbi:EAL domain-containing protein [Rhodococcus antarcticus]|uniref:EAL domain-containing protein n=1 Tax=Rhodococcus antarcticus TaxID=2987751 RepID=A0ABY6NZU4_9NOCA|nr:EAL domain-containing protein [Rhodococcus antarcticus]UZJ24939.1 EAL domain-containing protein [Rhodococcus antarcticus]
MQFTDRRPTPASGATRHPDRRHTSATHYVDLDLAALGALRTTVELARRMLGFPVAQLNILDAFRMHTLVELGTDRVAPRSDGRGEGLCDGVVRTGVPRVVRDVVAEHPDHPTATSGFRSYVGVPVQGREGLTVGGLCLIDSRPREITPTMVEQLAEFASIVEDQLDLARRRHDGALVGVDPAVLAAAVDGGEVLPWYQPLVDLHTGAILGFEALARWQHPRLGTVSPASFIPVAEDSDLVIDLDLAVLRRAMHDLAGWRRTRPELRLSVNLSAKHLTAQESVVRLREAAAVAGVPPHQVDLEITETAAVAASSRSVDVLAQLREHGFRVVLDDFGTGWSSLEHLLRLPVDGLKIDRGLTASLGQRNADAVVRAVTGMSRDMGLTTVIEGVESADAACRARALGCTVGQGYLWSAAVPAAHVPALLALEDAPGYSPPSPAPTVRAVAG